MLNTIRTFKYYKIYKGENRLKYLRDRFNFIGKTPDDDTALKNIFVWIKASFDANNDGGSAAYYTLGNGWKTSYPETTGYLIPTMLNYAAYSKLIEWKTLAKKAADWLWSIQSKEGGWQGLQVGVSCELRVFNTAMIMEGMVALYKEDGGEKYLASAIKAFRWLLSKIDADGFIRRNNVSDGGSFDTLTIACMLLVIEYLSEEERNKALPLLKNALDAHVSLQQENGWFKRCNFSDSYPSTALLHHIGYTVDGLLLSSAILKDDTYYAIARKTAKRLLSKFEVEVELPSYINSDWSSFKDIHKSKSSLCLTGYSQVAIIFQRMYIRTKDLRYLNAAYKINDIVKSVGNEKYLDKGLSYGLSGSYPIYGGYQPFKLVNWAAKYHADSVLMSLTTK